MNNRRLLNPSLMNSSAKLYFYGFVQNCKIQFCNYVDVSIDNHHPSSEKNYYFNNSEGAFFSNLTRTRQIPVMQPASYKAASFGRLHHQLPHPRSSPMNNQKTHNLLSYPHYITSHRCAISSNIVFLRLGEARGGVPNPRPHNSSHLPITMRIRNRSYADLGRRPVQFARWAFRTRGRRGGTEAAPALPAGGRDVASLDGRQTHPRTQRPHTRSATSACRSSSCFRRRALRRRRRFLCLCECAPIEREQTIDGRGLRIGGAHPCFVSKAFVDAVEVDSHGGRTGSR